MDDIITATQAARALGIEPRSVRKLLQRYGLGRKLQREYILSPEDLETLRGISTGKKGRPKRPSDWSPRN